MQLYQDPSPADWTRIVIDQTTYLIALNYGPGLSWEVTPDADVYGE